MKEKMKEVKGFKQVCFVFVVMMSSILISCESDKKDYYEKIIKQQETEISSLNAKISKLEDKIHELTKDSDVERMGRWLNQKSVPGMEIVLYKNLKNNKYYMHYLFKDKSESTNQVRLTKVNGLTKIVEIDSKHIEWYIIEKNGELSLWSQNGKFDTAVCF